MINTMKFEKREKQAMPVILLLDTSSSMSGGKIDSLNKSVKMMLEQYKNESGEYDYMISIFTFGNSGVHSIFNPDFKNAKEIESFDVFQANNDTPMGNALNQAKKIIEDKNITKSSWCVPAVILISDGQPTDSWEEPMKNFVKEGRSSKCERFALAIGQDADENVLNKFIEGTERGLFYAHNADGIMSFFKFVTMSTINRSKQKNPNQLLPAPIPKEFSKKAIEDNWMFH